MIGDQMHALARELWPLHRSLTGEGVRQTLRLLRERHLPGLVMHEVPSGTPAFDWTVPREWRVGEAYIETPSGRRICDVAVNNLHLVGYSAPVRARMTLAELSPHLHSLPDRPRAIPYVTSYYKDYWGFCLSHQDRSALEDGIYTVVVDTELFDGSLTFGELVIPGETTDEILLSTYVCHPSMANNELSGVVVTTFLARWLLSLPSRKHTYRILFLPETIGSLTVLSRQLDWMKAHVVAGYVVTCLGDERGYSFLPSRNGRTRSDQVARHVLRWTDANFTSYRWIDRGSDERQYCAPGVDLPIASIMRSKYDTYPEYHTSLDDLDHVVTARGLEGGFTVVQRAIESLERYCLPKVTVLGEPQLGRRGLYRDVSTPTNVAETTLILGLVTWSDGTKSLIDIADECGVPVWELYPLVDTLVEHGLLTL